MISELPEFADIALIVFDFDGVMTDNRVFVFEDGREAVMCNRADGLGLDMLRAAGAKMVILSTETNPVVSARARKLQLEVHHGIGDKAKSLSSPIAERNIDPTRVIYVGNDVNDLAAMKLIGWPIAPADAHASITEVARYITRARGGEGVIRELAEALLEPGTTLSPP